jgi:hypothetical protein
MRSTAALLLAMTLPAHAGTEESPGFPANVDVQYSVGLLHTDNDLAGNDLIVDNRKINFRHFVIGLESKRSEKIRSRISYDIATFSRKNGCESNEEIARYRRKVNRCTGDPLQEALVAWDISDGLILKIGKDRVHQGGWNGAKTDSQVFPLSPYIAYHQPFERHQPMLELSWSGLSLQLTDDVTTAAESTGVFTRHNYQPAAIVQFIGPNETISPRLQGAFYDLNKSYVMSAGLQIVLPKFQVTLDMIEDHRRQKFLFSNGPVAAKKIFRNESVAAEIPVTTDISTSLRWGKMDVRQPSVPQAELFDVSYNQFGFDDNYESWGGGVSFDGFLPATKLLVGVHRVDGRFLKSGDGDVERRVWNVGYVGVSRLE